jgi:hypothetical protein
MICKKRSSLGGDCDNEDKILEKFPDQCSSSKNPPLSKNPLYYRYAVRPLVQMATSTGKRHAGVRRDVNWTQRYGIPLRFLLVQYDKFLM